MAIQNRTVTIKNVFAKNASTTIPNPPVIGTSYRNTSLTAAEVGKGWPFKEIVDSAKFNEAMYEYTTICKQLETYGFLPWCASTNYEIGSLCLGTDGNIYQAKRNTGPSTTARNPVNDTSHTYWDLFYYGAFTANRAIASNASGKLAPSNVTATELGYLSGVTSAVQTQLNKLKTRFIPDYSAGVSVNGKTGYTATADGVVILFLDTAENDDWTYVYCNGHSVAMAHGKRGRSNGDGTAFVPVKVGDRITAGSNFNSASGYFYPYL